MVPYQDTLPRSTETPLTSPNQITIKKWKGPSSSEVAKLLFKFNSKIFFLRTYMIHFLDTSTVYGPQLPSTSDPPRYLMHGAYAWKSFKHSIFAYDRHNISNMVKPYSMRPVIYKPFHGLLILRVTNSPSSVSTESISSSAFRPLTNRNLLINLTDCDPRKATSTDCRSQLMTMLWNMRSPALVIRKTRMMMCYVRNRT